MIVTSTSTVSSLASVTVIVQVDAVELCSTATVTTSPTTSAVTDVLSLSTVYGLAPPLISNVSLSPFAIVSVLGIAFRGLLGCRCYESRYTL